MIIGGLKKVSLIDYPDEVSSVVFTQGCNMRCIYCHNSHLVLPDRYMSEIPEKQIFNYLHSRIGKIKAVVISGGEPTIHKDLPRFINQIKELGFKVKLDTNGTNPEMLNKLIDPNLIDFIAMDLKAPFEKYNTISGVNVETDNIMASIEIIKSSSVEKEFRMTFLKNYHEREDVIKIKKIIQEKLTVQSFIFSSLVLNTCLKKGCQLTEGELKSIESISNLCEL